MKIEKIKAREILDSRGNPTVAVEVKINDGAIAQIVRCEKLRLDPKLRNTEQGGRHVD